MLSYLKAKIWKMERLEGGTVRPKFLPYPRGKHKMSGIILLFRSHACMHDMVGFD